jgi:hypothetical protein
LAERLSQLLRSHLAISRWNAMSSSIAVIITLRASRSLIVAISPYRCVPRSMRRAQSHRAPARQTG